jgi:hypothetical protein
MCENNQDLLDFYHFGVFLCESAVQCSILKGMVIFKRRGQGELRRTTRAQGPRLCAKQVAKASAHALRQAQGDTHEKLPGVIQPKYNSFFLPYSSFTNSRIALPGSCCFIKFSPIKNPLNPASFSCFIVSGSLMALSDIFKNSDGICGANL